MKTGQINDQDYKELYLQTKQLYADMMTVYDELKKQVELLQQENFLLKETNEYYRKKLFGTKSETARSLGFEQLSLFDEAETILGENPGYVYITYKRKKKHKKVPGEISATCQRSNDCWISPKKTGTVNNVDLRWSVSVKSSYAMN